MKTKAHNVLYGGGLCQGWQVCCTKQSSSGFKQLNLSESTVHYFRKKDLHEVSKRAETENSTEVTKLNAVKCGRKVALEEVLDTELK